MNLDSIDKDKSKQNLMLKLFSKAKPSPLNLKQFTKIIKNKNEYAYVDNNKEIAYVKINHETGQIGIVDINREYQRRTLGRQITEELEYEFKTLGHKEIWMACSKDHYYWSIFPGFTYREKIHPSVNSCGFFKPLFFLKSLV